MNLKSVGDNVISDNVKHALSITSKFIDMDFSVDRYDDEGDVLACMVRQWPSKV